MKTSCKYILIALISLFLALALDASVSAAGKNGALNRAVKAAKKAGVTEAQLNRVVVLGHKKKLEPEETAVLLEALSRVREKGVPLSPFISKMEEGVTKRVPVAIIRRVLDKKLDDFVFVRDLMQPILDKSDKGKGLPPGLLERLAASLAYGITREELTNLTRQASPPSLPALVRGIEIMASLRQKQFNPDLTRNIVLEGLTRDHFTSEWTTYPRVVQWARKQGLSEKEIADATVDNIKRGGSMRQLTESLGMDSPGSQDGVSGPLGFASGPIGPAGVAPGHGAPSPGMSPGNGMDAPGMGPGVGPGEWGRV